jgi:hypothetical protein
LEKWEVTSYEESYKSDSVATVETHTIIGRRMECQDKELR